MSLRRQNRKRRTTKQLREGRLAVRHVLDAFNGESSPVYRIVGARMSKAYMTIGATLAIQKYLRNSGE